MRYQDQMVRITQKALDDICRAALAVPEDRREWAPMGAARSVLDQMREVAASAAWCLPIVLQGIVPEFGGHARAESDRLSGSFSTVEKCIEGARATTTDLCLAISAFPDAQLEDEITLPFGTMTMADLLGLHFWNLTYHLGQVNQLQLMLGDREMH